MHAAPFAAPLRALCAMRLLVAFLLLAGCAPESRFGIDQPSSACRINAVLYCEIEARPGVQAERCQCVSSDRIRDALRTLSQP